MLRSAEVLDIHAHLEAESHRLDQEAEAAQLAWEIAARDGRQHGAPDLYARAFSAAEGAKAARRELRLVEDAAASAAPPNPAHPSPPSPEWAGAYSAGQPDPATHLEALRASAAYALADALAAGDIEAGESHRAMLAETEAEQLAFVKHCDLARLVEVESGRRAKEAAEAVEQERIDELLKALQAMTHDRHAAVSAIDKVVNKLTASIEEFVLIAQRQEITASQAGRESQHLANLRPLGTWLNGRLAAAVPRGGFDRPLLSQPHTFGEVESEAGLS